MNMVEYKSRRKPPYHVTSTPQNSKPRFALKYCKVSENLMRLPLNIVLIRTCFETGKMNSCAMPVVFSVQAALKKTSAERRHTTHMNGKLKGMEILNRSTSSSLTMSTKRSDNVVCIICGKGIMIPLNEKSEINHCFKCNHCGSYANLDGIVDIE